MSPLIRIFLWAPPCLCYYFAMQKSCRPSKKYWVILLPASCSRKCYRWSRTQHSMLESFCPPSTVGTFVDPSTPKQSCRSIQWCRIVLESYFLTYFLLSYNCSWRWTPPFWAKTVFSIIGVEYINHILIEEYSKTLCTQASQCHRRAYAPSSLGWNKW